MQDSEQQVSNHRPGFEKIDPTLNSRIRWLVSALGGPSPESPELYVLGDDVLGCLRDIKRWLKAYDEKLDRLDVARCLSETNMVNVDLMEILSHSSSSRDSARYPQYNRISLACVELLVPLTWPLDKTEITMTLNHHWHIATLRRSQVYYKKSVLAHPSKSILKACCVNALPAMMTPTSERSSRDDGVIRLVLYLFRNLLQIEHVEEESDDVREGVSRSFTIASFNAQGIFGFLLSVISGVPENFEQQDVITLEVMFHLIQGVNLESFVTPNTVSEPLHRGDYLSQMLQGGEGPKSTIRSQSRHNRFGTTITFQKESGQRAVLSGHSVLVDEGAGLQKLDASKKWRKPQHTGKKQASIFGAEVHLSQSAQESLYHFLLNAAHCGFSALFQSVRKAIERDSDRIVGTINSTHLFYVGGAMIRFSRSLKQNTNEATDGGCIGFGELSSLFYPETFIVLFRHIRECIELKSWDDVQAGCIYFTQVLLAVSEMIQSGSAEEQSVAQNTMDKVFYEETLQELMVSVLRSGCGQTVQYLNTVTEMIHVFLRSLERYSRTNANMIVKSKRKLSARNKGRANSSASDDDMGEPRRPSVAERQFDFLQCENKFLSQPCLEAFLDFLGYYKEIDASQVRRSITFLHRIFVKREATIGFYSVRIILLLHSLAKHTEKLPNYDEVGTFVRHFSKQLVRKLNECPLLFVELLFQKPTKIAYFLQYGREREVQARRTRLPPVLYFPTGRSKDTQIAVAVSLVLQDDKCHDQLAWIESVCNRAIGERDLWQKDASVSQTASPTESLALQTTEVPNIFVRFDDSKHALMHFLSSRLQLLMKVMGFEINGRDESSFAYVLPNIVSAATFRENIALLLKNKNAPISQLEDGESILSCIRTQQRKGTREQEGRNHDNGGDGNNDSDLSPLPSEGDFDFPDNLPEKKSRRREKGRLSSQQKIPLGEDEVRERRERERRKGIKSAVYIASSDDDSDAERDREFFEKEQSLRDAMSRATIEALGDQHLGGDTGASKKRPSAGGLTSGPKRPKISQLNDRSSDGLGGSTESSDANT
ncbi:hypothetical protein DRE_06928 [Drechslerella stenobrocha 248]|uniref:Topoisomerase 1-associated factor 1 n=1 Tax=Drechslerella stenobrocha 248 TaxID=1043628 RepID=W7HW99_9PEZI|nr:hypothetical protein DRE_06928 [Drechslerella stenobrocha 248]